MPTLSPHASQERIRRPLGTHAEAASLCGTQHREGDSGTDAPRMSQIILST
jgi:hypothetical protein